MNSDKTCIEKEFENIERWSTFKLPNTFKLLGWILAISCFVAFLVLTKITVLSFIVLYSLKTFGVLGLAMIVLSKEKIEDEMVSALRGKAMLFAFVSSILFMIVTPYITIIISFIVGGEAENVAFQGSHFNMLSCVLPVVLLKCLTFVQSFHCTHP